MIKIYAKKKEILCGLFVLFSIFFPSYSLVAQTTIINPATNGGFEMGNTFAANGWSVTTGATNQWGLGTNVPGYVGARCAYISDNAGIANPPITYTMTTACSTHLYRDVTIPAGETNIVLSFEWGCQGDTSNDKVRVWLVPTTLTPTYNMAAITASGTAPTGNIQVGLANYSGQNPGPALTPIIIPAAYAGTTVRLIFEWTNNASGGTNPPFAIESVSLTSSVPTPTCATAISLPCGTTNLTGTTVGATNIVHGTGCTMSNYGTWYTFVGNGISTTISSTATGGLDHEMAIASGTCSSLTNVVCRDLAGSNGTETYTFTPVNGTTYFVYISHYSTSGTTTGNFTISRTCLIPPTNDDCPNAIPLTVNADCIYTTYTNANATASTSPSTPPAPGCANYSGGDVWFSFVVPANGTVTVDTQEGVMTDSGMAWYTGTCGALTLLECDDNDSSNGSMSIITQSGLTPGSTIYVRVWENGNNNNGTFGICATTTCITPTAALVNSSAVNICPSTSLSPGSLTVAFDATPSSANGQGTIAKYEWTWGDGTSSTTTTPTTTHTFPSTPAMYVVRLKVRNNNTTADPLGCPSTNSVTRSVTIMPNPVFTGTTTGPVATTCGGSVTLNGSATSQTISQVIPSVVSSPVALPDGTGASYFSPLDFTGFFPAGTTMTAGCYPVLKFDIEHSYSSDLQIVLIAPSGESVMVFNKNGDPALPLYATHLGTCSKAAADGVPGCPATYTVVNSGGVPWMPTTGKTTAATTTCSGYSGACMSGQYYKSQTYTSDNSFTALNGALLNGVWTLKVIDTVVNDDGVLSNWSLTFPTSCYAPLQSITPDLTTATWSTVSAGAAVIPAQTTTNTVATDPGPGACPTPGTCVGNTLTNNVTIGPFNNAGTFVYSFTATDEYGCNYKKDVTVNVAQVCPTASISYTGTSFCTGITTPQNVTLTGTNTYTTGTYSAPAGLTINPTTGAITPSTSTIGTYLVTYTIPINSCCTSVVTSTTTVVINAGKVWNGSASTNWNIASNWTPTGVPVNTDCVVVPNVTNDPIISGAGYNGLGLNLTIQNGGLLSVNAANNLSITDYVNILPTGDLALENSASLIQANNIANTGTAHIKRNTQPMYQLDYTYWNSPVTVASGFPVGNLTASSPHIYRYSPTIAGGNGSWTGLGTGSVMNPTYGVIVRAPGTFPLSGTKQIFTATFTGTPNNGTITMPISKGSNANIGTVVNGSTVIVDSDDEWNLIGNPYPSAVDIVSFLNNPANVPVVDGTVYLWTHNTLPSVAMPDPYYGNYTYNYTPNDYATVNSLGSTTTATTGGILPTTFIASGQSFFIRADSTMPNGTTSNVTFNNDMRVLDNNSGFYKNASQTSASDFNKQRLWLNLSNNNGGFSQILVGYAENATLGWDRGLDAGALAGNAVKFYSLMPDRKLTIQGRPWPFVQEDIVPLGYYAVTQGDYTIGIDHLDVEFNNTNVYLEDKLLNVVHNLKLAPYIYSSVAGTFDDRFFLRYTDHSLSTIDISAIENSVIVITGNNVRVVSSQKTIKDVIVYDILGREIDQYKNVNANQLELFRLVSTKNALVLKITLENNLVINKKIIY